MFHFDNLGGIPYHSPIMKKERKINSSEGMTPGGNSSRNKRGFSLVEFIMGSGVMTLVLAGCFSGLGQAILISENVKSGDFAAQILQCEMDKIHNLNWNEIDGLPGSATFDPKAYFTTIPLRDYSCQREINGIGSTQKEVRLSVAWTDLKGLKHNRELVTFYSKDGLFDYTYRAL